MSGTIEFSIQDHVARLTLDQPSRHNALTFDMWCTLPRLVATAEADPRVRLITVAGASDTAFSAGADIISEFGEKRSGSSGVARYDNAVRAASEGLRYSRLPTLALIHGICFGGGLGLALCCDLRFASSEARFRIPAGRLGLGYGYDNIAQLVHRVGPAAAAEILFTANTFDADRAKDLRLVQQVFDRDDFDKDVGQRIAAISVNAPLTLRAAKTALVEIEKPEAERSLTKVADAVATCFNSWDYKEGQDAFRQRRAPQFRGV
jgi:enoyl-CoA hydratase/carnithine racemase